MFFVNYYNKLYKSEMIFRMHSVFLFTKYCGHFNTWGIDFHGKSQMKIISFAIFDKFQLPTFLSLVLIQVNMLLYDSALKNTTYARLFVILLYFWFGASSIVAGKHVGVPSINSNIWIPFRSNTHGNMRNYLLPPRDSLRVRLRSPGLVNNHCYRWTRNNP